MIKKKPKSVQVGQKVKILIEDRSIVEGKVIKISNDSIHIGQEGEVQIYGVMKHDSTFINFAYPGARYDSPEQTITGRLESGEKITIPLTEVEYADVIIKLPRDTAHLKFKAKTVHARFRFGAKYPELRVIPIESINEIYVWHSSQDGLKPICTLSGLVVGIIWGTAEYHNQEDSFISFRKEFFTITCGGIGLLLGVAVGKIAAGHDHWEKASVSQFNIGIGQINKDAVGVSMVYRF
ncbi:MAG: hypothetical protein V3V99_06695 [candidate division Zixibacteria bacterium]